MPASNDVSQPGDLHRSFEERMRLSAQRLGSPNSLSKDGSPALDDRQATFPPHSPRSLASEESKAEFKRQDKRRQLIYGRTNPALFSSSSESTTASCERILPDDGGPPARRANDAANVIADACESVLIFQGLHYKDRTALYSNLYELTFEEDETIIRQGGAGRNMYIVVEGYPIVCEQSPDDNAEVQVHQRLAPGDTFGEAALVYGCPHSFSVCVPENSRIKVWALSRRTFRTLVSNATFERRKLLADVLVDVPPFNGLCDYTRMSLSHMFVSKHYESGEVIMGEGVPLRCHVIVKGQASAYCPDGSSELIGPNSYFGEEDLILDRSGVRPTTVVAYCSTETWSIDLCSFRRVLEHTPLTISELRLFSRFRHLGLPSRPPSASDSRKMNALKKIHSAPDIQNMADLTRRFGFKGLSPSHHVLPGSTSETGEKLNKSALMRGGKLPGFPDVPKEARGADDSIQSRLQKKVSGGLKHARNYLSMGNVQNATQTKPSLMRKLTLRHFGFLKEIGMGLTCKAYLCVMGNTNKHVVVKKMNKAKLIKLKQVQNVIRERDLLCKFNCPFILSCLGYFSDDEHLYVVLDFMRGGDLFQMLNRVTKLPSRVARFYAAQILLALEYIHNQGYIYRDLKPENILISETGDVLLSDLGFCKELKDGDRKYTTCGTTDYMAPEVLLCQGHNRAADLWAFGVLVYELLAGLPPFESDNDDDMINKCLAVDINFPDDFNLQARDLVKLLCKVDPGQRLGMDPINRMDDIKAHPFFIGVEWDDMSRMLVKPPDCKLIDLSGLHPMSVKSTAPSTPLTAEQEEMFSAF
ncbi:hypothetical protein CYMTET_55018 [Cymbomonas tetramitiformis]|uniref:cGMP-dependent protein kinase n=1 Tax=Cymbomonas tetramitiformis TaxID=36881 RepID=A0AAE0BEV6_9CHLO|nr:hypothetical protein CYMTET_55018 [Cymbomonas tetramitiformis]